MALTEGNENMRVEEKSSEEAGCTGVTRANSASDPRIVEDDEDTSVAVRGIPSRDPGTSRQSK